MPSPPTASSSATWLSPGPCSAVTVPARHTVTRTPKNPAKCSNRVWSRAALTYGTGPGTLSRGWARARFHPRRPSPQQPARRERGSPGRAAPQRCCSTLIASQCVFCLSTKRFRDWLRPSNSRYRGGQKNWNSNPGGTLNGRGGGSPAVPGAGHVLGYLGEAKPLR